MRFVFFGPRYIATWNAAMLQTQDIRKGMEAFASKQQPAFDPVDNSSGNSSV
jgi:hypothetical protein